MLTKYLLHDKEQLDAALAAAPEPIGAEFETKLGFLDPGALDRSLSRVLARQAELLREERVRKLKLLSDTTPGPNQLITATQPPANGISLASFSITGFQGIKNTKIDDLDLSTRWIFLTGENVFGKTSVLQALAHTLGGPREDFIISSSQRLAGNSLRISGEAYAPALLRAQYCRNTEIISVNKTWELMRER